MSSTSTRTPDVRLREVRDGDLDALYEVQREPEGVAMVGIGSRDRGSFDAHWARIRSDGETTLRTIEADGAVAGWGVVFAVDGRLNVGYWLGREFWGRGIASETLRLLVAEVAERPLWATVLPENAGSRRVLEKNGFVLVEAPTPTRAECLYVLPGREDG